MKSIPIAVTAVTFMTFIIIVFLFPPSPDPTSATMNYTVVVLGKLKRFSAILSDPYMATGGTLTLAFVYFYFPKYGGAVWFKGPVTTVEEITIQDTSFSAKDIQNQKYT